MRSIRSIFALQRLRSTKLTKSVSTNFVRYLASEPTGAKNDAEPAKDATKSSKDSKKKEKEKPGNFVKGNTP